MQKFFEAPDKCARKKKKKRNRPSKRKKPILTSAEPFRLKGLSSTQPLAGDARILSSPLDFVCGLCLLLSSRHTEAGNIK